MNLATFRSPKASEVTERINKKKMDLMERIDLDNQMAVLHDATMEREKAGQKINDEVEDLSNSLRAIIKEETVKPKLQCLMMDSSFSMIALQSEDSGILWETVPSCCSTPWALEIGSPAPDLSNSLVQRCSSSSGSESAGKILFQMDEDLMIRRKKRERNEVPEKLPMMKNEVPRGPDRPAMVEVSLPNVRVEKKEDKSEDLKEARKQRLFCLVSEGSEILNIVVPPKVSTVDEEASKRLVDNLFYLENTPVIKASEIPEEPKACETENLEQFQTIVQFVPEPVALPPPLMKVSWKQGICEDYFEKFTLLDHQAPSQVPTVDPSQESEPITEQDELNKSDDNAINRKPAPDISDESPSITELEISSEHMDVIFYGGGQDPDFLKTTKGENKEQPKSPLKKDGCDLFGSQESILTPIFLPEGPQKIIDLVLLEEPKAMAFMYSDLYADAVGSRKKQDDTESITSEKSFHSQESDVEDKGYLEKFVLKDETPVTPEDSLHDDCKENGFRMWSQEAFGLMNKVKNDTRSLDDVDEITDFFRNSASSSPCEPFQVHQLEPEETRKIRRVVFQDEGPERKTDDDIDIAEAFLPFDIGTDPLALEASLQTTDYKSVITEYAAKVCAPTQIKSEKTTSSSKVKLPKDTFISIQVPQSVKPIAPRYKAFLEITPLLPVEMPAGDGQEEVKPKDREGIGDKVCSSRGKNKKVDLETHDSKQVTEQEERESVPMPLHCSSTGRDSTNSTDLSQFDLLYDAIKTDDEAVGILVS